MAESERTGLESERNGAASPALSQVGLSACAPAYFPATLARTW